jgi:heavy metal translocating P-type ATPase
MLDNYQESTPFKQALQAGLISNPALLDKIRENQLKIEGTEKERLHLEIGEMWCPSCAEVIRLILLQKKGVIQCIVDYATDMASIQFSPRYVSKENIIESISALGYKPIFMDDPGKRKISLSLYIRFGVAAFCAMNAMMFSYPLYATYFDPQAYEEGRIFAWLSFLSSLPVITYCIYPILQRFTNSLRVGLVGMEALVIVGVFSAFGFSLYQMLMSSNEIYFDSMSVVVAFVLLGKIIESKAKFSSKETLLRLTRSLPKKARKKLADGTTSFVPIKEVQLHDILVAYTGEKIVLDGDVVEGEGTCDESLMTGESLPVFKQLGEKLLGGSIVQQGILSYSVSKLAGDTTLDKIVQLVEQDIVHKTFYERAADKIVRWFVPLVFLISFLTGALGWLFGISESWINAVAVLLIACPCALGIAAPLAESQILHKLTALGAFVRNRGSLPILPKITKIIFDKTGTITEGVFEVVDGLQHLSKKELGLLKGVSEKSSHPIARAIHQSLVEEQQIDLNRIEEYPGKGMKGYPVCLLGSWLFLKEHGLDVAGADDLVSSGITSTVYFSPDGGKVISLKLRDRMRAEIPEMIKSMKINTLLLSGDSEATVREAAHRGGFSDYIHSCMPARKKEVIEKLRGDHEIVCMVGDGINDAPALIASQVGISVISASDLSIQVSDILLTSEKLDILPQIFEIAKKGQLIIRQNLFWAFFYNCIGVGLAAFGLLSPLFAAFAMVTSSLIVVFNSKRI